MFGYFGYSKFGTESEHGHGEQPGIQYIAVAKTVGRDRVVVGSYCHHSQIDVKVVKSVLENISSTGHFNLPTADNNWNFLADTDGDIFLVICKTDYPQRCAILCLEECKTTFTSKFPPTTIASAKENALSKSFKDQFRKLCIKYNNPGDVDAIASAKRKVESVKLVMQDNVDLALQNCVKLESIEKAAEDLQSQAGLFKRDARELKKRMWWKNLKWKLIVGGVILAILGIIIGIIFYVVDQNKKVG
ncbi:VAMP726 [Symbiodinium microadriaticum]|nr:VAMP726 [Symbiodinium microadriaticum]